MLPLPNSKPSSPVPWDDSDGKHKRAAPTLQQLPILARRWLHDPPIPKQHRRPASLSVGALLLFVLWYTLLRDDGNSLARAHAKLQWGSRQTVENWGDHVGLGRARKEVLERTPSPYVDIGDGWKGGNGPLYRARGVEADEPSKKVGKKVQQRNWEFERDRHGIMGGASVEWSSGVVGSGTFLGAEVDMRKDSAIPPSPTQTSLERQALTAHILENGWIYLDDEDRINSEKLIAQAKEEGWTDKLPLRDQVRGNEQKQQEAADGWSRIYTVMEGAWKKSALETALEKMVRRNPVVVFSKTTCPHSKRAKALLATLHLSPAPQIVEVDLRPDAVPLKGLLGRRTLHHTFPNIIIGGKSIGGADDLERIAVTGELSRLLREMDVEHTSS